jgi:Glycosyltransferase like family
MIVFACAVREPEAYRDHAGPGLELAAGPGCEVDVVAAMSSLCASYNLLLDRAARRERLEALIVVQENVELADPRFCENVRTALANPDVAVVGCAGATRVEGAAWWDGDITCGQVIHRYREYGGGELDAFAWAPTGAPPAEVDTVAGFLLVLAPWAVRSLRFDERLQLGTGFDVDYCARARQAGKKVVAADLRVIHHHRLELIGEPEAWIEAHVQLADKWDGRLPGAPPRPADWKQRARLAEAERDAARTEVFSNHSRLEAELLPLDRELTRMTSTPGWRLTAPLRQLNALRKRRR